MNRCQQIHETIVRDIYDVITNVKDYDQVEWIRTKNSTGSIARRASNLILAFPVMCSTSLSIQTATIISKAIERKCVSLMQILFSAVQLTSAENMFDYLKQFHTNLDLRGRLTLDDFIDAMDTMANEGAITITDQDAYNAVKEDMKNINFYLSREYNPIAIKEYKIHKNNYGERVVQLDAPTPLEIPNSAYSHRLPNPSMKDHTDYFRYQLTQPEIDKANELMPTVMHVRFTTGNKGEYYTTSGVVGIKAKIYPIDSMDIVSRISSKHSESNGLFNLVRASTREISFFKDLAFMIDKAKLDAINMAMESNNARMFKVLERRAAKNLFSTLLKKNDASPITSLVISQEEVEYLKKYNDINMEKPAMARAMLSRYNLMDIVIADETLETAKFLFDDGDSIFEMLTFDSLEKQAKDSSYKKVINLMNKINR